MSRLSKYLLVLISTVFVLACNAITQPFRDAQEAVGTVQSIASEQPLATLEALASAMPMETLQSLATSLPLETLQSLPSSMPDIQNMTDPQGEPLTEWNGIPILPEATAGEETGGIYTFEADADVTAVFEYYKTEMSNLGWNEVFSVPDSGGSAVLSVEKDGHLAAITITADPVDGGVLVFLSYQ